MSSGEKEAGPDLPATPSSNTGRRTQGHNRKRRVRRPTESHNLDRQTALQVRGKSTHISQHLGFSSVSSRATSPWCMVTALGGLDVETGHCGVALLDARDSEDGYICYRAAGIGDEVSTCDTMEVTLCAAAVITLSTLLTNIILTLFHYVISIIIIIFIIIVSVSPVVLSYCSSVSGKVGIQKWDVAEHPHSAATLFLHFHNFSMTSHPSLHCGGRGFSVCHLIFASASFLIWSFPRSF